MWGESRQKKKSQVLEDSMTWLFFVPGAGVENMNIAKCKNRFLNPLLLYILLKCR